MDLVMYAVSISDEGDCHRCFPPDPGIETAALGTGEAAALGACDAAALGASVSASSVTGESVLSGTASASASLTFTLDSGASRSFFRDRTTLTPLSRPVAVSLADPSGGPVLSHFSTVLPCPAAPSGTLSGLYLPSFSTNLVSGADLQDGGVHQFTPAYQRVTHCTEASTGRHLATFTRQLGSSLYTLSTPSPPVAEFGRVAASGQVFAAASRSGPESAPCSCRLLSHETLLWHHRLGHPSLLRLRGMASHFLTGGLTERREPASRAVSPVRTARRAPRSRPPPVPGTHAKALHPSSVPFRVPLPAPPESSLPEVTDPESDHARALSPAVSCLLATAVTDPSFESAAASTLVAELLDFAAAYRLDYATALVAEYVSASPPSVGGEGALGTDVLEDRQEDFECLATAVPRFASMLLAPCWCNPTACIRLVVRVRACVCAWNGTRA
ncbi:unnamed protein product [Closterium sp. NIES-54]